MIFTTLNPYGNFDAQHEAMSSWASKFSVYSVNTPEEIDIIRDKYPYINFIENEEVYISGKKKLTKLSSILKAARKVNCETVAIVNSDIILNDRVKKILDNKYIRSGLTIATRWEIDEDKPYYPFVDGYDLFIFNKKYIDLYDNDSYVIGMPWWDYWIPLISITAGIPVYHIKNKVIFHRTHQTNYDHDDWIKFGEYLYRDIMISLYKNPIKETVYTFCKGVKDYIEQKQINIKIK